MKKILLPMLLSLLGVQAMKHSLGSLEDNLAETKAKLIGAGDPDTIINCAGHILDTLSKVYDYTQKQEPISTLRETSTYFSNNATLLVQLVGENVFTTLEEQSKLITRIDLLKQDVAGMAIKARDLSGSFLEMMEINDPSFPAVDKATYVELIYWSLLDDVIPDIEAFIEELKIISSGFSNLKDAFDQFIEDLNRLNTMKDRDFEKIVKVNRESASAICKELDIEENKEIDPVIVILIPNDICIALTNPPVTKTLKLKLKQFLTIMTELTVELGKGLDDANGVEEFLDSECKRLTTCQSDLRDQSQMMTDDLKLNSFSLIVSSMEKIEEASDNYINSKND